MVKLLAHRQGRGVRCNCADCRLKRVEDKLDRLLEGVNEIAIDQQTFDTDLAGLVAAINSLVAAVDALIASKSAVDLTAEDQSVQSAAAAVQAELAKITPPPSG